MSRTIRSKGNFGWSLPKEHHNYNDRQIFNRSGLKDQLKQDLRADSKRLQSQSFDLDIELKDQRSIRVGSNPCYKYT